MDHTSAASLTDVCFSYRGSGAVLSHLDLSLPRGKFSVLLGANGSGKSTLIGVLAGLLRPQRGEVTVDGIDIRALKRREFARRVAVLWQSRFVPEELDVTALVSRGRFCHTSMLRQWSAEDEHAVASSLARVGVMELQNRRLGSLSGGQLQRVWLATLLAQGSSFLILDEPTTSLDLSAQQLTLRLLRELVDEGRSVLASIHDVNHARVADYVVALKGGRVAAAGSPDEVVRPDVLGEIFDARLRAVGGHGTPFIVPEWEA